jgi:hypothetical protein
MTERPENTCAQGHTTAPPASDIERLQGQFGDQGWRFGSVWATAASGPDRRRLFAARDATLLTAWTEAELAIKIRQEG